MLLVWGRIGSMVVLTMTPLRTGPAVRAVCFVLASNISLRPGPLQEALVTTQRSTRPLSRENAFRPGSSAGPLGTHARFTLAGAAGSAGRMRSGTAARAGRSAGGRCGSGSSAVAAASRPAAGVRGGQSCCAGRSGCGCRSDDSRASRVWRQDDGQRTPGGRPTVRVGDPARVMAAGPELPEQPTRIRPSCRCRAAASRQARGGVNAEAGGPAVIRLRAAGCGTTRAAPVRRRLNGRAFRRRR